MGMEYIRFTYGVPVRRGARVEYTGDEVPKQGTVTGTNGSCIRVRLDGERRSRIYHPRWEMKYLDRQPTPHFPLLRNTKGQRNE